MCPTLQDDWHYWNQFRALIINSKLILCRIKPSHTLQFNAMESLSSTQMSPSSLQSKILILIILWTPVKTSKSTWLRHFWSVLKHHKWWVKIIRGFWASHTMSVPSSSPHDCNTSAPGHGLGDFFLDCNSLQGTDSPNKCCWGTRHLNHLPPKVKAES